MIMIKKSFPQKEQIVVHVNEFSIGWLKGVHISSILFEVIRTILGLFIIFLQKDFECKEAPKCRIYDFYPLRSFCVGEKLFPLLFFICFFFSLVGFGLICFFYTQNLFVKKISRPEIVRTTSNTILLEWLIQWGQCLKRLIGLLWWQ